MLFFIQHQDIDCRTEEEFEKMPLLKYNIPIIDSKTHQMVLNFISSL